MNPPRKQCAKCPWKVSTDPHDIPDGYDPEKHAALKNTIADGSLNLCGLRMMACHETGPENQLPCVGWLANQLGHGNNIGLRLAVINKRVDANVKTVGEQHQRFEDTLP